MKQYIEIEGKKYEIKGEPEAPAPETTPEAPAEEIQAAAKQIGAAIRAELGIDDLKKSINDVQEQMQTPANARLKELLNGKDMFRDKDSLTKEEKIIAFFHALVTRNEAAVKALSTTAADGGNLFPTEFQNEIIKALAIPTRMRSIVSVKTMHRTTLTVPKRGTVVKVYWTAENASKTTTTATWSQVTLTARKAAAIIYASDEVIEDSNDISIVNEIIDQFATAIGDAEDLAIALGNGTTQPTGIETARAAGTIASTAVGATLDVTKIVDLVYGVKPQYRNGGSFLMNPKVAKFYRKLVDSTGRPIWQDSVIVGMPSTLYGYPVYEFYDLPTSVTYFGNWKLAYWLGDRKQMTVKISQDTETAFTKDETAIRVVFRIGGNVVLGEAAYAITHAAQ